LVCADDERACFMIVRGKQLESGRIGLTIMETSGIVIVTALRRHPLT